MVRAADSTLLKPASAGTTETSTGQSNPEAPANGASADSSPSLSDPNKLAALLAAEDAGPTRSVFDPRKSSEVENPKAKEYQQLAKQWLAEYKKDPTNTLALIQIGKAYFGLGEYDKTILAYDAFLKVHPRDLKVLQLRAETYAEIVKVLKSGVATVPADTKAEVQALIHEFEDKFEADQVMSIALNAGEERKQFRSLAKELKAQSDSLSPEELKEPLNTLAGLAGEYLRLGSASFKNGKDAEFVRQELSALAAETFELLAKVADGSSYEEVRKLAPCYDAYHFVAQGDVKSAQGILKKLVDAGDAPKEARQLFETIEADQLRNLNLTALEVWESYATDLAQQESRKANESIDGQIAQGLELVFSGKSALDRSAQALSLEKKLITEVRRKIVSGECDTIFAALSQLAESGPEELRASAGKFFQVSAEADLRRTLVGYVAQIPPDSQKEEILYQQNLAFAGRDQNLAGTQTVFLFLGGITESASMRQKVQEQLSIIQQVGEGYATANIGEAFNGVAEMIAATAVGAPVYLGVLARLEKIGVTGWRGIGLAMGVAGTVEGAALGTIEISKVGMSPQGTRALTPDFIAKSYGANILMMTVLKPFMKAGEFLGPQAARGLGLVAEGGAKLSLPGRAVAWGAGHGFGFGGMVASTQLSQAIGFAEAPAGGFKESLAHDFIGYVRFAIAHKVVDHFSGGRVSALTHAYHSQAKLAETRMLAEANVTRLGYGVKGRVQAGEFKGAPAFADPQAQALFEQFYSLSLTREGFNGAKLSKLLATHQHGAARVYLEGFGLKPKFEGKHFVGIQALSLHEQLGVTAPKASPRNFAKLLRGLRQVAIQPAFWMVGIPGEGPMGKSPAKGTGTALTFPGKHEAAYQEFKAASATYRGSETEDLEMEMREKRDDAASGSYREEAKQRLQDEAEAIYYELSRRDVIKMAKELSLDELQGKVAEARQEVAEYLADWYDYSKSPAFSARAEFEALEEILAERLAAEPPPAAPAKAPEPAPPAAHSGEPLAQWAVLDLYCQHLSNLPDGHPEIQKGIRALEEFTTEVRGVLRVEQSKHEDFMIGETLKRSQRALIDQYEGLIAAAEREMKVLKGRLQPSSDKTQEATSPQVRTPRVEIDPTQVESYAKISDEALDKAYGYGLSKPETFGFEANKGSARRALELMVAGVEDVEQISAAIHEGWGEVAKTYEDPVYQTKPEKRANRLKLANTSYEDLPEAEKEKDRVVARALLKTYRSQKAEPAAPPPEEPTATPMRRSRPKSIFEFDIDALKKGLREAAKNNPEAKKILAGFEGRPETLADLAEKFPDEYKFVNEMLDLMVIGNSNGVNRLLEELTSTSFPGHQYTLAKILLAKGEAGNSEAHFPLKRATRDSFSLAQAVATLARENYPGAFAFLTGEAGTKPFAALALLQNAAIGHQPSHDFLMTMQTTTMAKLAAEDPNAGGVLKGLAEAKLRGYVDIKVTPVEIDVEADGGSGSGRKITFNPRDEAEYQRLKETTSARYAAWHTVDLLDAATNLSENGNLAEALPLYIELERRNELELVESQEYIEGRMTSLQEELAEYLEKGDETSKFFAFMARSKLEVLAGLLSETGLSQNSPDVENALVKGGERALNSKPVSVGEAISEVMEGLSVTSPKKMEE